MIEKVSFTNFKSLRNAEIALGRFMVIVGPNGSGKTSILDGLHEVAQLGVWPQHVRELGGVRPASLISRGATGPMELKLSGHSQGTELGVRLVMTRGRQPSDTGFVPDWEATVTQRYGQTKESTQMAHAMGDMRAETGSYQNLTDLLTLQSVLRSVRKLRLDGEKLAAASYSEADLPSLGVNGEGLATVLYDLGGRLPENLQSIQDAARHVFPALEGFRTRRAKVAMPMHKRHVVDDEPLTLPVEPGYWGHQLVLDFKGAPGTLATLASEGTLLVIGILTALYADPRPRVLLIDNLDKALHPRAQEEVVKEIRKALAMNPELQVIATSHSPYLIDHFEPEEVLVTALQADGSTACAPLTAHPDFERWKDTTRAGELWSFVGEDWVVKRASAEEQNP